MPSTARLIAICCVVAFALFDDGIDGAENLFGSLVVGDAPAETIPRPEIIGAGVGVTHGFTPQQVIEFDDFRPIGGVCEREAQQLGIILRLLKTCPGGLPCGFRFYHGQRKPALVIQQVIRPFRWLADEALAHRHDASIRDRALFRDDMGVVVPPGFLQSRDDEFPAGIGFCH